MMGRVVVCGSLNMDVIVQSDRRPVAGETILGARVSLLPGGKGSNQAIASARLGAATSMMGCVGDDAFGRELIDVLARNRVDKAGVKVRAGAATGVALIQVSGGDNAITGAGGANDAFAAAMVRRAPRRDETWVFQFENSGRCDREPVAQGAVRRGPNDPESRADGRTSRAPAVPGRHRRAE